MKGRSMTEKEKNAIETIIESNRNFMRLDFDDYTSKFITKKSFDDFCQAYFSDELEAISVLENFLLDNEIEGE